MLRHPKLAFMLTEVCPVISRPVPDYDIRIHIVVNAHGDSLESTEKRCIYLLL